MKKSKRRATRAKARKNRRVAASQQKTQGFTLDADLIEKHILEESGEFRGSVERVVLAGMNILFSDETHYKLFDGIDGNKPLDEELGSSAVHIMMIIAQRSNNMPGEALIPAGTILLAKACAFIARSKMFPINDQVFYDALEMFMAVVHSKAKKQHQGNDTQEQPVEPQSAVPQKTTLPSGGMLQGG